MNLVKPRFPEPFKHAHPPVRNINEIIEAQLTFGQKASDWVATNLGSWWFIIIQTAILMAWVIVKIANLEGKGGCKWQTLMKKDKQVAIRSKRPSSAFILICMLAARTKIINFSQDGMSFVSDMEFHPGSAVLIQAKNDSQHQKILKDCDRRRLPKSGSVV